MAKMKNKPLGSPVIDVTAPHPSWYQPHFERPDRRQYELGELVKVHVQNRPKNDDNELEYNYYMVFEDGRGKTHRTYTYGLDRVHPPVVHSIEGRRVYGCYPIFIEPCTEAEKVLYYTESALLKAKTTVTPPVIREGIGKWVSSS